MLDKAESQPHIQALKDFMANSGLQSLCALKHFFRTVRTYTEIDPEPRSGPSLFKVFRIRHSNRFGELSLISAVSLGQICSQSRLSLTELSFENCVSLDSDVVHALAQCKALQTLNLSYSVIVDDAIVGTITRNCKALRCLILQGLPRITARTVDCIGSTKVTKLDLSLCANVLSSRSALFPLLKLSLTHLLLNGLDVQDSDLEVVAQLRSVQFLSLANCSSLSDRGLVHLSKGLGDLEALNLETSGARPCLFSESVVFHMLKLYLRKVKKFGCPAAVESNRIVELMTARRAPALKALTNN